jgi:iron(II)-dependent oxidoreductase
MDRKDEIRTKLEATRSRTLWMLEQVPDEFLRVRVHSFYSPIGWHFGHVGRTEEYWICAATGRDPCDEHLSFLYADLPDNPKDNRVHIPDRVGTLDYLDRTRRLVLDALERADIGSSDPFMNDGYAWEFAIQHECQHQETIAEMLQLIQKQRPQEPIETVPWRSSHEPRFIDVPSGSYLMGHPDIHGYDNEKERHEVAVRSFRISDSQVTSFEWSQFMEDGGYDRPEFWSEEGWAWKTSERADQPEYWIRQPEGYAFFGAFGARTIHPDEPVSCISQHEALAFAKWAGKRLPTEEEWEYVASTAGAAGENPPRRYPWGNEPPDETRACFTLNAWSPEPVKSHPSGATGLGVHDLAGNVWEWTSSTFLPYPGFAAFPYDGYSKDHMKGAHRVCRGGSWATSPSILRCSFRNWYVPTYRQGFLGLRLAAK